MFHHANIAFYFDTKKPKFTSCRLQVTLELHIHDSITLKHLLFYHICIYFNNKFMQAI